MTDLTNETDEVSIGGSVFNGGLGLPKEPPMALLISMAIRYDHGLAIPNYYDNMPIQLGATHKQRFDRAISIMRQLYEEVSGYGFYSADKEAQYLAMHPNV